MKCKNCSQKEVVKYSKYSSGEFCSRECARAYSTKTKRKEINKKVSKKLKNKKVSENSLKNLEKGRLLKKAHSEETKIKISKSLKGRKSSGGKKAEKLFRNCILCGHRFFAGSKGNKKHLKRKFCSKECANSYHSEYMAKRASNGFIKNKGVKCEYIFNGKNIKCDSKIEYACLDFFEKNYEVINIKRSDVVIEYNYKEKTKRYNPDFEIVTSEGNFIVECKTIIKNHYLNDKWRKYNEVSKIKKEKLEEYADNKNLISFWFTKDLHRKFYDYLTLRG